MYIHNPTSAIIYRFVCLLFCSYGIFINITPISPSHLIHMLSYYTILTNLLCVYVYIRCILISTSSMMTNTLATYDNTIIFVKGLTTMSVIISCIAYHYILGISGMTYTIRGIMVISSNDLFVHYLVPFLTVADWLLFQPKGMFKWKYIFYWLLFPLIYLSVIMIKNIFYEDYPYFFMDISENGLNTFLCIIAVMAVLCLATGTILVLADFLINRCFPTKHSCKNP